MVSLIGEKVDIHLAEIRNRIWKSEIVRHVEEKRDE